MKFLSSILYFIFLLSISLSCTAKKELPSKSILQKQWMLIEFQQFSKNEFINKKAQLDWQKPTENHKYFAKIGCMNLEFKLKLKDTSSLTISKITKLPNNCEPKDLLESTFLSSLPTMKHYIIEGHFLTLSNNKGEKMKFVASDWD